MEPGRYFVSLESPETAPGDSGEDADNVSFEELAAMIAAHLLGVALSSGAA